MSKSTKTQGLTYCRPDFKAPNAQKQNRCDKCGFKNRGGGHHEESAHHKIGKAGRATFVAGRY